MVIGFNGDYIKYGCLIMIIIIKMNIIIIRNIITGFNIKYGYWFEY